MSEKTVAIWAAITPNERGPGHTEKAYFLTVAIEGGKTEAATLAKSITVNKDGIVTSKGEETNQDWQQFIVPDWWVKKLKAAPAKTCPSGKPVPPPAPSEAENKSTNTALANRSTGGAIASASNTSAQKDQRTRLPDLPNKSGMYTVTEGGKSKEVPNTWTVQVKANEGQLSTDVIKWQQDKDGFAVVTRAWNKEHTYYVDDLVEMNFEIARQKCIMDEIDRFRKAEEKARRGKYPNKLKNPLAGIADDGSPVLTQDASYAVWKRWVQMKFFAGRICTTKSASRAQWKMLSKDFREDEEKRAERTEIAMVNPDAKIVPPKEDAAFQELDEEVLNQMYESTLDAEKQAPTEGPKHTETLETPPRKMEPQPPLVPLAANDWDAFVESLKATTFYNDPAGNEIAQKILANNGRVYLDLIRKAFPDKVVNLRDIQEAFSSAAVHKDPLYFERMARYLESQFKAGEQATKELWSETRIFAAKGG